jgi:tetratricopeptide (TPR) repeat protein
MNDNLLPQFSEAVKLHERGLLQDAEKLLLDLSDKDPASVRILIVLGHVYYDMGQFDKSEMVFRRATALAPTLEAVSKGLFHSLWKLEKRVEALEEIKRFQGLSYSKDYEDIVKEINQKWI